MNKDTFFNQIIPALLLAVTLAVALWFHRGGGDMTAYANVHRSRAWRPGEAVPFASDQDLRALMAEWCWNNPVKKLAEQRTPERRPSANPVVPGPYEDWQESW